MSASFFFFLRMLKSNSTLYLRWGKLGNVLISIQQACTPNKAAEKKKTYQVMLSIASLVKSCN